MKPTGEAETVAVYGFDLSATCRFSPTGRNGGGWPPRIAASHPFQPRQKSLTHPSVPIGVWGTDRSSRELETGYSCPRKSDPFPAFFLLTFRPAHQGQEDGLSPCRLHGGRSMNRAVAPITRAAMPFLTPRHYTAAGVQSLQARQWTGWASRRWPPCLCRRVDYYSTVHIPYRAWSRKPWSRSGCHRLPVTGGLACRALPSTRGQVVPLSQAGGTQWDTGTPEGIGAAMAQAHRGGVRQDFPHSVS